MLEKRSAAFQSLKKLIINGMHIGQLIREELDRQPKEHTVTWFADQLNCNRRNVYDIFNRHDIDTSLLKRISTVLRHDFFSDLSDELKQEPGDVDCE